MAGSVARKPQGLCAPHVVQINLLGRFPRGTQSLTAETLLSPSRERERARERHGETESERGGGSKRMTRKEKREMVNLGLGGGVRD